MNVRSTSDAARHVICSANKIRHASAKALSHTKKAKNLGTEIWVYHHLIKNHVVYSLTKALNNNAALSQLPFNGKKTVPRALRKDHWHPMAKISFRNSPGSIGISVFQKLREYRKRHEHEWDDSLGLDKDGKPISKKQRNRKICDQKANSVADMAAVLARLDKNKVAEAKEIGLRRMSERTPVEVSWSDMLDAEFAETWSDNVVHDQLEVMPNNRHAVTPKWVLQEQEEAARQERLRLQEEEAERLLKKAAALKAETRAAHKAKHATLPPRHGEERKSITL